MKQNNVKYKKITIELPINTYEKMNRYCRFDCFNRIFYKDFINYAILFYLKNFSNFIKD